MRPIDQNLCDAAANGHLEAARLAIENGAIINVQGNNGQTPLYEASRNGNAAIVSLLLQHNADINVKNNNGDTALHIASWNGHDAVVLLLLQNGADVNAQRNDGDTALHKVCRYGRDTLVLLLLRHGADLSIINDEGHTPLQVAQNENKQKCIAAIEGFRRVQDGTATPMQLAIEQLPEDMRRILTCPISGDIMQDPVILVPSTGKTFNRESLCTWLLRNPTPRCPWTNQPLDRDITYVENRGIRDTLTLYLGEEAYVRYDDSDFKLQYQALWNEPTYREIAALLYGMNYKQIDWVEAQEKVSNVNQEDSITVGFKSLLLHPEVFPNSRLQKNKDDSGREWERAVQLGLSILADAGNPWAQWLKGIHLDVVEQDHDAAKAMYNLAADQEQGLALAQNGLGILCEEDEQFEWAEYWYEQASLQGHALAQYNLANLCIEEDLNRAQEYFQRAAAQGQIEAQDAIENLPEGTDIEQVHE
jgi:hypothetical protein